MSWLDVHPVQAERDAAVRRACRWLADAFAYEQYQKHQPHYADLAAMARAYAAVYYEDAALIDASTN